jgi:ribosomal protein S18 acetylase RimI-like enzyme
VPTGLPRLDRIRALLAGAFADDPLLRWVFPDDQQRPAATAAWLGLVAEGYRHGGRVDVVPGDGGDDDPVAVALWRLPDREPVMPTAPSPRDLLGALVGPARAGQVLEALGGLTAWWLEPPFAYLHLLAVRPSHQGRGLGRQVLAPGLAAASEAGLPVQLETMNPASRDFYRSVGLAVTAEVRLGSDGPTTWVIRGMPALAE